MARFPISFRMPRHECPPSSACRSSVHPDRRVCPVCSGTQDSDAGGADGDRSVGAVRDVVLGSQFFDGSCDVERRTAEMGGLCAIQYVELCSSGGTRRALGTVCPAIHTGGGLRRFAGSGPRYRERRSDTATSGNRFNTRRIASGGKRDTGYEASLLFGIHRRRAEESRYASGQRTGVGTAVLRFGLFFRDDDRDRSIARWEAGHGIVSI